MSKALISSNAQGSGMKNRIINGGMDISQRGTSFVSPADTTYSLDRWRLGHGTDGAFTITQASDAPSNNEFQNSLRLTVTTADTSLGASQRLAMIQMIEGYNVRDLIGRTFTFSFWVRSTKTGIHCIALRNDGLDRSYVAEYTINTSNTWEYKTITIAGGLPTAGTWNYTNGAGLICQFSIANGSDQITATTAAWVVGNLTATSNQVNCLDTIGNIFAITGVQLEVGAVATPFEHRLFGAELALCQRYYEITEVGSAGPFLCQEATDLPNRGSGVWYFKVTKRAIQNVGFVGAASDYSVRLPATSTNISATVLGATSVGNTGVRLLFSVASGITQGTYTQCFIVNSGAYVFANAEL